VCTTRAIEYGVLVEALKDRSFHQRQIAPMVIPESSATVIFKE